jgi:homoserine O-acetyltransferase
MDIPSNPTTARMGFVKRQLPRISTVLSLVTLCTTVAGCSSPPQPRDPVQQSPTVTQDIPPSIQSTAIDARQADAFFANHRFRNGETLDQLRLHYAVLGEPHRDEHGTIDNAVLFLHWTNASSRELLTPEYKQALFAPGAPFDTTRFFVIIPDNVGHGQSSKPSDGLRARFPRYGYSDMVDLQHRLVVETLGVTHLRAVVGMSMGCMNAWQWAEAYPDAVDGVMPVACFPSPISGRNLLWRRMVVDLIKSDPAWADGNYQTQPPSVAMAGELARMMINGVPNLQEEVKTAQQADEFIRNVKTQAGGQDANDLLYSLEASGDFDAEPDLGRIKAKVFALNFADDEFYRDSLQVLQRAVPKVQHGRLVIRGTTAGSAGHYSMAHPGLWKDQAADFVDWLSSP